MHGPDVSTANPGPLSGGHAACLCRSPLMETAELAVAVEIPMYGGRFGVHSCPQT